MTTPTSTETERISPAARRTIVASFVGGAFEFYDFILYTTTAALVFNKVFFPQDDPSTGALLALSTTAVGYVMRPLGGLIFGHFGDRVGRKRLLVITMLTMGVPTVLIGLLPGYATLGFAAPLILVVLRMLQGIGLGGEYAGAALATIESVPVARRGLFGSIPQMGNPAGSLLAALLQLIMTTVFGDAGFAAFAWRIPFVLSVILLVYGLIVRLRLVETGDFTRLQQRNQVVKAPIVDVLRYHWRPLLLGLGTRISNAVAGNVAGNVLITYIATVLNLANGVALTQSIIGSLIGLPYTVLVGKVADRIGRKTTFQIGLLATAAMAYPLFLLADTKVFGWLLLGSLLFKLADNINFAVQTTFYADIFPVEVRYTALSMVYQFTAIIGGLTAPAAFALVLAGGGQPWLLAGAVTLVSLFSFVCGIFLKSEVKAGTEGAVVAA